MEMCTNIPAHQTISKDKTKENARFQNKFWEHDNAFVLTFLLMHTVLYILKKHTKLNMYYIRCCFIICTYSIIKRQMFSFEMSTLNVLRHALQALYTLWIFSFDLRLKNYLTRSCKNTPCFLTPMNNDKHYTEALIICKGLPWK